MMPLGTEVSIGQGDIVLDGDPAPPPRMGHSTSHFSVRVYMILQIQSLCTSVVTAGPPALIRSIWYAIDTWALSIFESFGCLFNCPLCYTITSVIIAVVFCFKIIIIIVIINIINVCD